MQIDESPIQCESNDKILQYFFPNKSLKLGTFNSLWIGYIGCSNLLSNVYIL